jgi:hypothetical protein
MFPCVNWIIEVKIWIFFIRINNQTLCKVIKINWMNGKKLSIKSQNNQNKTLLKKNYIGSNN